MSVELSLSPTNVRYSITTDIDPGIISRVLEHFAIRGITPDLLKVSQYKSSSSICEKLSIDIHLSGLSAVEYELILQKILSQVGVQNARMECFLELVTQKKAS